MISTFCDSIVYMVCGQANWLHRPHANEWILKYFYFSYNLEAPLHSFRSVSDTSVRMFTFESRLRGGHLNVSKLISSGHYKKETFEQLLVVNTAKYRKIKQFPEWDSIKLNNNQCRGQFAVDNG